MTIFFSEIFGVDKAEGMTCSAFILGVTGMSATVVGVVVIAGVSATGAVAVLLLVAGLGEDSAGVELTLLLFFLKGQPRWIIHL